LVFVSHVKVSDDKSTPNWVEKNVRKSAALGPEPDEVP
jgi:hypothetical protein